LAVLGIFSYQFEKATAAFESAGVPFETLTNYSILLDVALKQGSIQQQDLDALRSWSTNPSEYGS
jgi:orotate phosphoribosyltransferase